MERIKHITNDRSVVSLQCDRTIGCSVVTQTRRQLVFCYSVYPVYKVCCDRAPCRIAPPQDQECSEVDRKKCSRPQGLQKASRALMPFNIPFQTKAKNRRTDKSSGGTITSKGSAARLRGCRREKQSQKRVRLAGARNGSGTVARVVCDVPIVAGEFAFRMAHVNAPL